jgi:hypothetical protein
MRSKTQKRNSALAALVCDGPQKLKTLGHRFGAARQRKLSSRRG